MTGASEWQGGGSGYASGASGAYGQSWGQQEPPPGTGGRHQASNPGSDGDGPDWVNLGIVGGGVIIVCLLVGIGWLLLSGDGDGDGDETTTTGDGTDQSTTTEASTDDTSTSPPTGSTDLISVLALDVGHCFTEPETNNDTVEHVPTVDCAEPHDYEVYKLFDLEDGVWRGGDQVQQEAEDGCESHFEEFVGIPLADSELEVLHLTPTIGSWEQSNDRTVKCILQDPAGQVSGSLEGAAR